MEMEETSLDSVCALRLRTGVPTRSQMREAILNNTQNITGGSLTHVHTLLLLLCQQRLGCARRMDAMGDSRVVSPPLPKAYLGQV